MRENTLRRIWADGGFTINGWLQLASSYAAEVMAHLNWDSLTIDMQHGPVDFQDAVTMLQAISTTSTIPMARVPWNDPAIIMRMLDAGCYGIICPMINTRAEAEAFVGACRYPPHPLGYRSFGPNRARLYGGADYAAHANDTVLTIAMIETATALENLDEILSVDGLDAIYIGPADLSQSLGGAPGVDFTTPPVTEALDTILSAAQRHGVFAGLHTGSVAYTLQMKAKGFQFATLLSDSRIMAAASEAALAQLKDENTQVGSGGPY